MAQSRKQHRHITRLNAQARKPRRVECEECGKTIIVKGRQLQLCKPHRKEHIEKVADARKRKAAKPNAVRGVRKTLRTRATSKAASVPRVQKDPHNAAHVGKDPKLEKTKSPAAHQRGTFAQAVGLITDRELRGQGFRHGLLGTTGSGKTTGMRALVLESSTLTLIHDDSKPEVQYKHDVVRSFDQAPDDAKRIVFRGDAFADVFVEVEEVADITMRIARATRKPVRLVVDEVDRACSEGMREITSPAFKKAFHKGRGFGVSVMWSTVQPQIPATLIDQASTISFYRMGPRALNYAGDVLKLDKEMLDVILTLEDFEFVIYEQGRPWNRIIYPTPTPQELEQHGQRVELLQVSCFLSENRVMQNAAISQLGFLSKTKSAMILPLYGPSCSPEAPWPVAR